MGALPAVQPDMAADSSKLTRQKRQRAGDERKIVAEEEAACRCDDRDARHVQEVVFVRSVNRTGTGGARQNRLETQGPG